MIYLWTQALAGCPGGQIGVTVVWNVTKIPLSLILQSTIQIVMMFLRKSKDAPYSACAVQLGNRTRAPVTKPLKIDLQNVVLVSPTSPSRPMHSLTSNGLHLPHPEAGDAFLAPGLPIMAYNCTIAASLAMASSNEFNCNEDSRERATLTQTFWLMKREGLKHFILLLSFQ